MITILSSPKAFAGIARHNQLTAIKSWKRIHPDVEIFLYGDAAGTADCASQLGVIHVPSIESSESGVPLFGSIIEDAEGRGRFRVLMYLNCDVILTPHVLDAVRCAEFPEYLMIGQRIDLSERVTTRLHNDLGDDPVAVAADDKETTLHAASGIDYFIFTRGLWTGLKSVVIGRGGYDSALVSFCLKRGIPVIDTTFMIPALHQFHDYGHVKGAVGEVFWGEDAQKNRRLHGLQHSPPNVADATWKMIDGRLRPNNSRGDVLRALESSLRYRWNVKLLSYGVRAIWRLLVALRLYRVPRVDLAEAIRASRSRDARLEGATFR
jgi:hypothetical protein